MNTPAEDQEQMDYVRGYRAGKLAAKCEGHVVDLAGILAGLVAGYLIGILS
ncbi:hypothetical protein JF540_12840 [Salipiger thiooxidans]|uniref:hypothetical protein n=1 Tax=Salipiger thiooxidans TaxID=282683 RepID=UPI001A8D811E|nr:hypothetical protein [Salipiger thiooxidans]MBN8187577.1 hypothetical protein [Salipiger thiooxidans]